MTMATLARPRGCARTPLFEHDERSCSMTGDLINRGVKLDIPVQRVRNPLRQRSFEWRDQGL